MIRFDDERTRTWVLCRYWWRLQVGLTVHRHGSGNPRLGDRWVVQPSLVYDRKPPAIEEPDARP